MVLGLLVLRRIVVVCHGAGPAMMHDALTTPASSPTGNMP
jgi:hypothetical protein